MIGKVKISYLSKVGRKSYIVSLNQYKSEHWRKLKSRIDPLKEKFCLLIKEQNPPKFKWIELRVEHNTNFDIDNLSGTVKIFVDCLRRENVIEEDDKRFWDYMSIKYNPEMKKNYLSFEITGEIKK